MHVAASHPLIKQRTSKTRAAYYAGLVELYAAERYFLETYVSPDSALLDIGVGAGRTTVHFEPRVAQYCAIDYSAEMLRAFRARFPAIPEKSVVLADARALPFYDGTFEQALFSNNGLDYVSRADRGRVLTEVRRVLKPGGYFLFSTHNIDWDGLIDSFCVKAEDWRRPLTLAHRLRAHARNGTLSIRSKIEAARVQGHGVIVERDARCCHTSYRRELEELAEQGFANVRAFDYAGTEVRDAASLRGSPFIHFIVKR